MRPTRKSRNTRSSSGGTDAVGCQNATVPPSLSDGATVATAGLEFTYDASTQVLSLKVSNTSPDLPGTPNPVITQICFNLPEGTASSLTLLSQLADDGSATAFDIATDMDLSSPESATKMGCLGYFNVCLASQRVGIANPAATTTRPGDYIGPVVFELQLAGPGVGLIDAYTIAAAFSRGAASGYNAGVKFQGGGENAEASGFISSEQPDCIPSMWIDGAPSIGSTINLCVGALTGCHGCLLVSLTPGPAAIGPYTLPIGLPLAAAVALPDFAPAPTCFEVTIPDAPILIGESLYFCVATFGGPANTVAFSPAFVLTFQP